MPRRIADPGLYDFLKSQQPLQIFVSLSAFGLGLSTLIFFVNFFYSMFKGPKAPRNPWNSTTLEWTLPSPPGHGNFEVTPTVYNGPYEYSVPGMDQDFLPQNQPAPENCAACGSLVEDGRILASKKTAALVCGGGRGQRFTPDL